MNTSVTSQRQYTRLRDVILIVVALYLVVCVGAGLFKLTPPYASPNPEVIRWALVSMGMILGGALLAPGLMMGVHDLLHRFLGVSKDDLFGWTQEDDNIGLVPLAVLEIGAYSVLGELFWSLASRHPLPGIVIGGIVGIFQVMFLRWRRTFSVTSAMLATLEKENSVPPDILHALQGVKDQVYPTRARFVQAMEHVLGREQTQPYQAVLCRYASRRAWIRIDRKIVGVIVVGVLFFFFLLTAVVGVFYSIDTGEPVGAIVFMAIMPMMGPVAILLSWARRVFREIVIGGIIITIVVGAGIGTARGAFMLADHGIWITIRATLILTGLFGMGGGVVLGMMFQGFIGILLLLALGIKTVLSAGLSPLLILLRYRTIICQHCLRYTGRFHSRYDAGKRYCGHCEQEVEQTQETGTVILTFGKVSADIQGRVFVLSDPDFEQKEQPLDVCAVYIDAATADGRLLERFITYIINYPPRHDVESMRIFYRGELDELGDNLQNALRNTFPQIEGTDEFKLTYTQRSRS